MKPHVAGGSPDTRYMYTSVLQPTPACDSNNGLASIISRSFDHGGASRPFTGAGRPYTGADRPCTGADRPYSGADRPRDTRDSHW